MMHQDFPHQKASMKEGLINLVRSYKDRKILKYYKKYQYQIYPRIKNFRGSTKICDFLKKEAFNSTENFDGTPESVTELNFDYLFLLDACRYDKYKYIANQNPETRKLKGELNSRVTLGSSSAEYIQENFTREKMLDTVYISGNPHLHPEKFKEWTDQHPKDVFHEVFHTYKNSWNDNYSTVIPSALEKDLQTAEKLFPDKRKIVHFMQPHQPYTRSNLGWLSKEFEDFGSEKNPLVNAERGKIQGQTIRDAYYRETKFIYRKVHEIAEKLDGRVLISSDHGEFLGEEGLYGHPGFSDAKILRKVPLEVVN